MSFMVVLTRLVTAVVLGGIIGMERQSKHRPAGFRTHILVCLGAALIMCLSEYLFVEYHTKYGITPDPARLGAQVISGIGFLGAGTIIHYGTSVKGLTTAASLWAVACIGLSVGAGFYSAAIVATVIITLILIVLTKISLKVDEASNNLELLITFNNLPEVIGAVTLLLGERDIKILDLEYIDEDLSKSDLVRTIRVILQLKSYTHIFTIMDSISNINGVVRLERI